MKRADAVSVIGRNRVSIFFFFFFYMCIKTMLSFASTCFFFKSCDYLYFEREAVSVYIGLYI